MMATSVNIIRRTVTMGLRNVNTPRGRRVRDCHATARLGTVWLIALLRPRCTFGERTRENRVDVCASHGLEVRRRKAGVHAGGNFTGKTRRGNDPSGPPAHDADHRQDTSSGLCNGYIVRAVTARRWRFGTEQVAIYSEREEVPAMDALIV